MDSKTVKFNGLILGELEKEPIFLKQWSVPLSTFEFPQEPMKFVLRTIL